MSHEGVKVSEYSETPSLVGSRGWFWNLGGECSNRCSGGKTENSPQRSLSSHISRLRSSSVPVPTASEGSVLRYSEGATTTQMRESREKPGPPREIRVRHYGDPLTPYTCILQESTFVNASLRGRYAQPKLVSDIGGTRYN